LDQLFGTPTSLDSLDVTDFPSFVKINAMDKDESSGTMYVSANGGSSGSGPNYLGTVDLSNGVVTNIGQSINGLDALAVDSELPVGGTFVPLDSTSLLVSGASLNAWMIPVILAGIGIAVFVFRRN